jgi:hypothetical protein
MHESLAGNCRQDVVEDCLVPGHLGGVGRILLLRGLVVNDDGDLFLRHLLDAKDEVLKLCGSDGRQDLSAPKWVISLGQLEASR